MLPLAPRRRWHSSLWRWPGSKSGKVRCLIPIPRLKCWIPASRNTKSATPPWNASTQARGGRYLLFSDIPNNRMLRWLEDTGEVTVFRHPSNYSNGNCRDREGRLLTCEHDTRRVTRTEYDGSITVLLDRFQDKKLNAPNNLAVHSDGAIWFSDPGYGIM